MSQSNNVVKKKIISNPKQEVSASKITKVGKEVVGDEHFQTTDLPDTPSPVEKEEVGGICSVRFGKRQVVSMGNFETIALELSASMECAAKDMNKTYTKVKEFVEGRLEIEVDEVYNTRDAGGLI